MSRELQSATISFIVKALLEAQKQINHAIIDAENPHYDSEFASLESVINATKPHLLANGIVVTQQPFLDENGHSSLVTTLAHTSGEWIRSFTPIFLEKQTYQSLGSGITYMRRYSLAAIANIGQKDDDGNKADGKEARESKPVSKTKAEGPVYPFAYPEGLKGRAISELASDELLLAEKNLMNWKTGKNSASYPKNGDQILEAIVARLPKKTVARPSAQVRP